jgi:hypothetical protein
MTLPARALAVMLIMSGVACGCSRSKPVAFARLLDQAASWAASVEFASDMHAAGDVPRAYVEDLLQHAVDELTALRKKTQSFQDVAPPVRSEAASVCGQLAQLLAAAARDGADPDRARLRALEARLRDLSLTIRSEITRPDNRGSR